MTMASLGLEWTEELGKSLVLESESAIECRQKEMRQASLRFRKSPDNVRISEIKR